MHPHLAHRQNDLHLRDIHAVVADSRGGTRVPLGRGEARGALAQYAMAALAAIAVIFGAR